ncbi:MAG TPA: hypothetical protein VK464_24445 [Symbiobacteriaceae bacterium]|nr:hypothetical protein [Symbiobacteriaceae bacterium]
MTDRMERILAEAIAAQRPVLVNPTEDEIRLKAEELRQAGKLTCTFCRRPILEESFRTRRISFGPRLQAVAHLHCDCEEPFAAGVEERAEAQGV